MLTIAEFCAWADPPVDPAVLTGIVRALRIRPAGTARTAAKGRPANTYRAGLLMELHAKVIEFTGRA